MGVEQAMGNESFALAMAIIAVVFIVVDRVFGYINQNKSKVNTSNKLYEINRNTSELLKKQQFFTSCLIKMESQIGALFDWHNIKDKDGTPIWYEKTDELNRILNYLESHSKILQQLVMELRLLQANLSSYRKEKK